MVSLAFLTILASLVCKIDNRRTEDESNLLIFRNMTENLNLTQEVQRHVRSVDTESAHSNFHLLQNWHSFPLVVTFWISLLLISTAIYVWGMKVKTKMGYIYDGCTSSTVNYKYIVRLAFGAHSKYYKTRSTYITMDFLDDSHLFITRIAIPPIWMSKEYAPLIDQSGGKRKNIRATKLLLNRAQAMRDIRYLRLSHDQSTPIGQFIQIYYIEIKDLVANLLTTVPVSAYITNIPPDSPADYQVFEAEGTTESKGQTKDLFEEGITPKVTPKELPYFYFLALNVFSLIVLLIPFYFNLTSEVAFAANMVAAGILSFLITLVFYIGFRKGLKQQYASNHGTGAWDCVRMVYLYVMAGLAIAIGLTAALFATSLENSEAYRWFLSCLIMAVLYIVIALLMYFLVRMIQRQIFFGKDEKSLMLTRRQTLTTSVTKSKPDRSRGKGSHVMDKVSSVLSQDVVVQMPKVKSAILRVPVSKASIRKPVPSTVNRFEVKSVASKGSQVKLVQSPKSTFSRPSTSNIASIVSKPSSYIQSKLVNRELAKEKLMVLPKGPKKHSPKSTKMKSVKAGKQKIKLDIGVKSPASSSGSHISPQSSASQKSAKVQPGRKSPKRHSYSRRHKH